MAALTPKAVPDVPEAADPHPVRGRIIVRAMQALVVLAQPAYWYGLGTAVIFIFILEALGYTLPQFSEVASLVHVLDDDGPPTPASLSHPLSVALLARVLSTNLASSFNGQDPLPTQSGLGRSRSQPAVDVTAPTEHAGLANLSAARLSPGSGGGGGAEGGRLWREAAAGQSE